MKEKLILILAVNQFGSWSSAAILRLAGTVPDRGFSLNDSRIEPVKKSALKVFVSEPQNNGQWRQVRQTETLPASAKIRILAP